MATRLLASVTGSAIPQWQHSSKPITPAPCLHSCAILAHAVQSSIEVGREHRRPARQLAQAEGVSIDHHCLGSQLAAIGGLDATCGAILHKHPAHDRRCLSVVKASWHTSRALLTGQSREASCARPMSRPHELHAHHQLPMCPATQARHD